MDLNTYVNKMTDKIGDRFQALSQPQKVLAQHIAEVMNPKSGCPLDGNESLETIEFVRDTLLADKEIKGEEEVSLTE